jgi:hypothetical protein
MYSYHGGVPDPTSQSYTSTEYVEQTKGPGEAGALATTPTPRLILYRLSQAEQTQPGRASRQTEGPVPLLALTRQDRPWFGQTLRLIPGAKQTKQEEGPVRPFGR